MTPTTVRELGLDGPNRHSNLLQKVARAGNRDVLRMRLPGSPSLFIETRRFGGGFDPERIGSIVAASGFWSAQVNDGLVASELPITVGSHFGPELVFGPQPIGQAIERAAITQGDRGGLLLDRRALELALDSENRTLGGAAGRSALVAGKAAAKQDARRLGKDRDMAAEVMADHF